VVAHHRGERHGDVLEEPGRGLELIGGPLVGDVAELDHELGPRGVQVGDSGPCQRLRPGRAHVQVSEDPETEDRVLRRIDVRDFQELERRGLRDAIGPRQAGLLLFGELLQPGDVFEEGVEVSVDPVRQPRHEQRRQGVFAGRSREAFDPLGV
jgi:hypothetical protein